MKLLRITFFLSVLCLPTIGLSQCPNFNVQISTQDTICVNYQDSSGYSYQFNPTVSGGVSPYTYNWIAVPSNSATFSSSTASNPIINLFSGQVEVILTVIDTDNCIHADTVVLDTTCQSTLSILEEFGQNEFSVYPNPANEEINILGNFGTNNETATIFSFTGQMIEEYYLTQKETKIDVSNLTEGVYFILFENSKERYKIIVKR